MMTNQIVRRYRLNIFSKIETETETATKEMRSENNSY